MAAALPILIGVSVAGTVLSAVGQLRASKTQAAAYEYNAKVDKRKALHEEQASRTRFKRLMASQRALYAKAGVDLSSGSPIEVLSHTAALGEQEALNIRIGGQEASALGNFYARTTRTAGKIGAGATLLTGLGQAGGTAFLATR